MSGSGAYADIKTCAASCINSSGCTHFFTNKVPNTCKLYKNDCICKTLKGSEKYHVVKE